MDANNTTFRSVEVSKIQRAFAMAHRCATDPDIHDRERKYFRAIAYEIWKACGESGGLPERVPQHVRTTGAIALQGAETLTPADQGIAAARREAARV